MQHSAVNSKDAIQRTSRSRVSCISFGVQLLLVAVTRNRKTAAVNTPQIRAFRGEILSTQHDDMSCYLSEREVVENPFEQREFPS